MRKRLFSVRHSVGVVLLASCLTTVGSAVQADSTPQTGADVQAAASTQVIPPTQTWEERTRELLRRLYIKAGGNASAIEGLPLKNATVAVSTQFSLFGLVDGLAANEVADLERDALELADCAEWEPGPPTGTSYGLIVLLHGLGKTAYATAVVY